MFTYGNDILLPNDTSHKGVVHPKTIICLKYDLAALVLFQNRTIAVSEEQTDIQAIFAADLIVKACWARLG